jgi:hypothetical protein
MRVVVGGDFVQQRSCVLYFTVRSDEWTRGVEVVVMFSMWKGHLPPKEPSMQFSISARCSSETAVSMEAYKRQNRHVDFKVRPAATPKLVLAAVYNNSPLKFRSYV